MRTQQLQRRTRRKKLKLHAFNPLDICKFVRIQDKDKYDFQFGLFGDVDIGVILKDCKEDIEAQQYYKKEIEEIISSYKRKCYIKKLETNNTVLYKNNITILNTQFFYSNFN